jgi:hypothetical protein
LEWTEGEGGIARGHSQLVAQDNARVARRFPHTPERPRDGRRCHTSAGEEVIPAPALRRSVPTKRMMRELLVALTSARPAKRMGRSKKRGPRGPPVGGSFKPT